MMTLKVAYLGGLTWYRTDSYWDWTNSELASTWGPSIKLSANYVSAADNNGATYIGKTFVFAYSDGSGVQLNHLSFATVAPTSNTTAGSGTNNLITAPLSFTNSSPGTYSENYCSAANLLIEGTTDTTTLAATILSYSDGYKATSTLGMEYLLAGAAGGWRGACYVYYSGQYIQDATNGAVCHSANQSSASGAGPTSFGASYIMHVPASTWAPPASSAAITPSSMALTASKYGVTYSPSTATSYLFTEGYYAAATWY